MKKSLSLILAIAMAFSMFANVAFAADTTTTATPKTTEEKYEALKAKGIFEGDDTGANLTGDMTRAQLAKIVAILLHLDQNKAANTYTDVAADHWAAGYIGAVTEAKIFDGTAPGKFEPEAKVQYQQLAKVLVATTGLTQSTDAVTGKVDDWAKGYVAAAVKELGLSQADYTANATRGVFVELTFAALPKVVIPGKVSVVEAKATGVQAVTVKFNKPVDDSKAKLALTRGTSTVATTTKFSEDKASAVLTLTDVKIAESAYTVTLSGLAADDVVTTTATFNGEAEKVTKLSFVNPSEKIAQAEKIIIKVKPENQYGEVATLSGTDYSANVSGTAKTVKRNSDTGLLEIEVDTSSTTLYPTEIGVLPITVNLNLSSVFVQKTFKIGYPQVVSKVELGEGKYGTDKKALSKEGDKVEYSVKRFDQYGDEIQGNLPSGIPDPVINPTDMNILEKKFDSADKKLVLTVKVGEKVQKTSEHTVTYYEGGASATAKLTMKAVSVPAKLEFGTFNGYLASKEIKDKFIPIIAYDAEGKQLTADEIVDAADLITFTVTGATVATNVAQKSVVDSSRTFAADATVTKNGVVRYGENKGKLKIVEVQAGENGIVYLYMSIYNSNIQTQAQTTIGANKARIGDTVVVTKDLAKKALPAADPELKVIVKDQYGEDLDSAADYKVEATVTGSTYASVSIDGNLLTEGVVREITNFKKDLNDKKIIFTAKDNGAGKATLKLVLKKNGTEVKTVEKSLQVIESKDLTYTAKAIDDVYAVNSVDASKKAPFNVIETTKFAKSADVNVTDKSGDSVSIKDVKKQFSTAFSSDPSTVSVAVYKGEAKILGLKAGTATVTAIIEKANGETQEMSYTVNVKADQPAVATLSAKGSKKYNLTDTVATLIEAKVVDNYGVTYEKDEIAPYNTFFGVQYVISNVKGSTGATVKIGTDGKLVITGTVDEFVVKTISSNGKVATTVLTLN